MKKIVYILACVSLLVMTACNDFLEEEPRSSMTSAAYYKTEAQALANVNYLYRNGAPGRISNAGSAYVGPNASIDPMLTGYFTNSYEGQETICLYARQLTRQQNTSTVSSTMNSIWDNCYRAINVANGAIKYIPGISMASSSASKLIAEAKFFRAFNYYYLVKTFGDVPMPTEPYESMENIYLARTPKASVYELMESDLKDAVDALPATKFASNNHRITKYAAAMLLSNVYLRQNKYGDAAKMAKIVIESPHKLATNDNLALGSAFNKLRSTDDLDEVIYAQEYDATINNGGWWPTYAFSSSAVSIFGTYSIFERVFGPTDRFLKVYKTDDLRIQPNQFFHWNYTNPETNKTWTSTVAGCWYYYDEEALLTSGKSTKDWNFYRLAEALLVGAEAIAQSEGVTAEAAGYLAQIKARADMNGKTVDQYKTELQAMSKDNFVKECWTERLREFPLEFKIWDDCTRTGMFPVISATVAGQVDYVALVGAKNGSDATFKESDLLWPISHDELQRNPQLVQNPGYN
ncbi:RagB/SusD family nutrient uptake outer membrane protein [Dysgonomonas sp. Marseille-P4677]|uniref:RagB/SusD family nutrient uptake outer membrane protein n=1 Tax=Dysgonomonas sp. Marseille-P4677 TaxID=2364790 RepID=UPI001914825E|nr:RagB/SusD family nutrient uptake outer membrane protein [Dysgonomonas sp. Marseille-P4677]MBK5720501.1 RagB/SusD family nutrient uptake outer membrane protein [Dysgonomonas sp. Marseille-P4677]